MLGITFSKQAKKTLLRMQKKTADNIVSHIRKLAENPARTDLDIKKLHGRDGFRLRVGDWRILYTEDGLILSIEKIGPRGDVYK